MDESNLTWFLARARAGDRQANEAALELVYQDLRAIARNRMPKLAGATLQPTALVHEAYLRSLGADETFENRRHFFFVASRAMKDILVEHARRKSAQKRGGDVEIIPFDPIADAIEAPDQDMLALGDALARLEADHPRPHEVVMLRFFGGLSSDECAELLERSKSTVDREWAFARAYLYEIMSGRRV